MKMNGIWERHKKKIMAIVMAVLMVAFTLPSSLGRNSGGPDVEVGKLAGTVVRSSEVRAARAEFDRLRSYRIKQDNPFAAPVSVLQMLPPSVLQDGESHEDFWFLLLREAKRTGAAPSEDQYKSFVTNRVEIPPTLTADQEVVFEHDLRDFLSVLAAAERAMDMVKVSEPLRQMTMAEDFQQLTLRLVEFPTAEFRARVPEPTDQQIRQQFAAYADKDPQAANTDPNDKFDFGYRYPNRVKFQYIGVRHADLMKTVQSSQLAHEWEVAARRHYILHKSEFTAPPSTQPATQPASSQPAIQPFEAVRTEILDRLQNETADKLLAQVMGKVTGTMTADYAAWKTSTATSKPSSVGPAYGTYEYLPALAADIQKQFAVLPVVGAVNELTPARDLGKVPGIGSAALPQTTQQIMQGVPAISIAIYMDQAPDAFAPESAKERALKPMQPSAQFRTPDGDVYLTRVTDAIPAHAPADVKEVRAQVVEDVKTAAAFNLAQAAAREIAKAAEARGIDAAAKLANRPVTQAGPFMAQNGTSSVPGVTLPDQAATRQFIAQAIQLVRTDPKSPHAVKLIELPKTGRLYVAELVKATPAWGDATRYMADGAVDQSVRQQIAQPFVLQWFDYANVVARSNWQPEAPKHGAQGAGEPLPDKDVVPPAPRPF